MRDGLIFTATLAATLGAGLMAGLFFAFSTSVMSGLGRIAPAAGIAAMQSINVVIQNPVFFLAFFGTALLSLVLIAAALLGATSGGAAWLVTGGLLYLTGILAVTIIFNVPMNNALGAVDPASAEGARVWADYLSRWVFWNHVRTLAGLASLACFALALK